MILVRVTAAGTESRGEVSYHSDWLKLAKSTQSLKWNAVVEE